MSERRFGDVVVRIDRTLCVGFGDCVTEAPDTFALDDEGLAVFIGDGEDRERLRAACEACPVDALTLHEADESLATP
ncbi:MAG TPA: ferredoxin [Gemmatimonadota bacterium]|nr:ferredoxin [Gemmatimonadota bacterium]